MTVNVFQVELTGFTGGPGVNTWTFVNGAPIPGDPGAALTPGQVDSVAASLGTIYSGFNTYMQNDVTWTIRSESQEVDEVTGQLQNITSGENAPISGTGTATAVGPHFLMMKTQLRTDRFSDGRRIQGGPFIGPMTAERLSSGGSWLSTSLGVVETALSNGLAAAVAAGAIPVVWRRPRPASSPLGERPGTLGVVSASTVWSKPAVLRSRRD
jgi:hypothetical protein